ncbi:haloalkane dehalogenase [Deinococcus cellulosilyticus]|uniref:Haloalkane dehalogenase n=1 Tax=Deinococcus cellulosilyticus (strain DSM 18568 / NBRC 106333 / KACC 11606 / 5516J-15) TaxID=1223518 RepID=A0A511N077_DEIC1|nr:haloalkane dehalogenase [Deinococcus cellulosilyticus]GEM46285.1 haloalkane dehalogenase [Deinococcus cellulosilyticus NBRC 106333 = KACC 11606]
MPEIQVLDSTLFYQDAGAGTPVVFLHGSPVSSHLWRNVLPQIQNARTLALDLIGMGKSGKPDLPYRFADHARYLDAWMDALQLENIILVGIDWGGALAFDWARRHSEKTRGIVFMETILKPMTWEEFPPAAKTRFEAIRTPGKGEKMIMEDLQYLETALTATVLTPLAPEDFQAYLQPFLTPPSRRPLLEWPRAMPLEGEPQDVIERIKAYNHWLKHSIDVPKLLLTFEGSPTLMVTPQLVEWCRENISHLEIQHCGPAGHLAPEDQPEAIAAAINGWMKRNSLWT